MEEFQKNLKKNVKIQGRLKDMLEDKFLINSNKKKEEMQ